MIDHVSNRLAIQVVGHRGAKYPGFNQNTLRVFKEVIEQGAKAVELDVHLSKDRVLVVLHNQRLEGETTGSGQVSEHTLAQLKQLKVSIDPSGVRDDIPTLNEVFDLLAAYPASRRPQLFVELKGTDTGQAAAELLLTYIARDKLVFADILFISFGLDLLQQVRRLDNRFRLGVLGGNISRFDLLPVVQLAEKFHLFFSTPQETYIFPKYFQMADYEPLITQYITDQEQANILRQQLEIVLEGRCYNDKMLKIAEDLGAERILVWYRTITASFVSAARARNFNVYAFTVNDREQFAKMVAMGVAGIITDDYQGFKNYPALNCDADI